jgi:DnaJ-class molecular chaperone
MATPHKCPVCGGTGVLYPPTSGNTLWNYPCDACNGTGIVWGSDIEHVVQPVYRYDVHAS